MSFRFKIRVLKSLKTNLVTLQRWNCYCSSSAVKVEKTDENDNLLQKIIFNSVLQTIAPEMGFMYKKNMYKKMYSSENIIKESQIRTSAVCLKYLNEEQNQGPEEEEDVNTYMHEIDESVVHFPFHTRKSYITEKVRQDVTLNPDTKELLWNTTWKKEIRGKDVMSSMAKKHDDASFMSDRLEVVPSDEFVRSDAAYGTANANVQPSRVPCGGCGAVLHCQDTAIPGFLPQEIFCNLTETDLRGVNCQRCHFLKEYDTALGVSVVPEEYPQILSHMKNNRALVVLMVDLLDFPCSVWPDILDIIGYKRPVVVVGNKLDLIMQDGRNFLQHVKDLLLQELERQSITRANVKHVALISAKTGYGVESLINKLHTCWQYQGDVYIVGCTNVGKSTLFNALIQSDYCRVEAVDILQRATTSRWPGTTLNLLKFPILRPSSWRLFMRTQRLISERGEASARDAVRTKVLTSSKYRKQPSFIGFIRRTFQPEHQNPDEAAFAPSPDNMGTGLNPKNFRNCKWCYDTPGVVQPEQLLNLLTTAELVDTLPKKLIVPRNYHLKQGMSLFLGGLGRIDFVSGPELAWFTVFASDRLPVTITTTEDADLVYSELVGSELLGVPRGPKERMAKWPGLSPRTVEVRGSEFGRASADVVLSSAGWVAITIKPDEVCGLQAWTPRGSGIHVRSSAIVRKSYQFRGCRIGRSPAFNTDIHLVK